MDYLLLMQFTYFGKQSLNFPHHLMKMNVYTFAKSVRIMDFYMKLEGNYLNII